MAYGLIHHNQPDLESLEDFFEFASEAGFDAVELMPGDVWPKGEENPEAHVSAVKKQVDAAGLKVCAVSAGNDFVYLDDDDVEREVR